MLAPTRDLVAQLNQRARSHRLAGTTPTIEVRLADGNSASGAFPRLAGQHADYTEAQLIAFRGGVRTNSAQMTGVAAKLNDREIKAVADYIAGLR